MKKKKLKILKLSKDMQKEFVGGQVVKVAEYDSTKENGNSAKGKSYYWRSCNCDANTTALKRLTAF